MKRIFAFGSLVVCLAFALALVPARAADEVKAPANAPAVDSSRLSPELLEIAKLAQSGVDEAVLLAFVERNPLQRSPTADELVYLKNVGLSGKAMVALMNSARQPVASVSAQTVISAPVSAPAQTTVVSPPVVYAPATPPAVYVDRPYVNYVPYPTFSFGWDLGHHDFGHHSFGHHGGGHHGGGHHGGHH